MNAALLKQIQANRDDKNVYGNTNTKVTKQTETPKPPEPQTNPPLNIPYTPDENDVVIPDESYYAEFGPSHDHSDNNQYDEDIKTTPNPDDIAIEMHTPTKKKKKKSKKKSKKSTPKHSKQSPEIYKIQSASDLDPENDETNTKKHKRSLDEKNDKKRRKKSKDKTDKTKGNETPKSEETKTKKPFVLKQYDVENAMKKTYRVGTICRIHSMEKQTQYNNKFCRIIGYKKAQIKGGEMVYYVKILDRFKRTYFYKANVLKVEDLSDLDDIKERKCALCSCFVFLGILAVIFIGGGIWCYFFYKNDGFYYYASMGSGGVGVVFIFMAILSYLKERFCCCFCNCCYYKGNTVLCC